MKKKRKMGRANGTPIFILGTRPTATCICGREVTICSYEKGVVIFRIGLCDCGETLVLYNAKNENDEKATRFEITQVNGETIRIKALE